MERVLLVDDEPNVLASLRRQLHKEKFDIHTAQNGFDALEIVHNSDAFAVIVSDYHMPGMNGLEFLLQTQLISPDTSRVVLTGNTDIKVALDAINRGNLFRFLLKPSSPDVFLLTVKAGIEQYRLILNERELMNELSTMQHIDRQLNTNLDVRKTMSITLEWALDQSGAAAGMIGTIEENNIQIITSQGYTEEINAYNDPGILLTSFPSLHQIILNEESQQISGSDEKPFHLLDNSCNQVIIPIRRENMTIGILFIENTEPDPLPANKINFLIRLCDHASIAIANAQLLAAAQAANLAKSEFVSYASHELSNPLTAITGYSDMLTREMAGSLTDIQKNFVNSIVISAKRMINLIADLSGISQIESGHLKLDLAPVSLEAIINEVVSSQQLQITEKNQTLLIQLPENLPQVIADRFRITQIITNLISNAHKYTPEEKEIVLSAEVSPDHWNKNENKRVIHISVRDKGIGISPEDQKKIFQKFFRATDLAIKDTPGTGLGLNITRNLVEMHGGSIWFESELRKGTTFHFTLPIS